MPVWLQPFEITTPSCEQYLLKITYLSLFIFEIYHKELRTLFFIVTTIKQTGLTR